jgi:glycosyltransferase involved in cell wall biosynthesis
VPLHASHPLRILGLIPNKVQNLDDSVVGADAAARGFYGTLQASGHDVRLFGSDLTTPERIASGLWSVLRYGRLEREFIKYNLLAWHLRTRRADRYLRRHRHEIDLVILNHGLYAPYTASPQVPYAIYTDYTRALAANHPYHTPPLPWANARQRAELMAREHDLYRNAWHIFTPSALVCRSMLDDYGIPPEKVTVIWRGVPMEARDQVLKRDWTAQRAVFVGEPRSFERKGAPELLDAFAAVRRRLPQATLTMVGPTSAQVGARPGVCALGLVRDRDRVRALLRDSTCFVLPTRQEPFGLALLEAMAHGLPIVATQTDAVPEIVQDGESGILVPPLDSGALADALVAVLSDPECARQMGAAGLARLRARFTWPDVVARANAVLASFSNNHRQ